MRMSFVRETGRGRAATRGARDGRSMRWREVAGAEQVVGVVVEDEVKGGVVEVEVGDTVVED